MARRLVLMKSWFNTTLLWPTQVLTSKSCPGQQTTLSLTISSRRIILTAIKHSWPWTARRFLWTRAWMLRISSRTMVLKLRSFKITKSTRHFMVWWLWTELNSWRTSRPKAHTTKWRLFNTSTSWSRKKLNGLSITTRCRETLRISSTTSKRTSRLPGETKENPSNIFLVPESIFNGNNDLCYKCLKVEGILYRCSI